MKRRKTLRRIRRRPAGAATLALLFGLSCGGSADGPTEPPLPTAPTATPTPAAPTPTPAPVGAVTCPYGKGRLDADCSRSAPRHLRDVEAAVDDLVGAQPEIFNLSEQATPRGYRVVNVPEYFRGVVRRLQAAGFCAESDGFQNVQVKKSAELSERFAILTSSSHVRRGDGSYRESCRPAIFPVDDVDHIDAVRVHFFSIRCPEGIDAPDNAEKKLPVGCTGWVSATPKDRNNKDVPPAIHGPDVHWETFQGEGENLVKVNDVPDQPFNKLVDALEEGYFTMCATVKTVRGCFGFHTIR